MFGLALARELREPALASCLVRDGKGSLRKGRRSTSRSVVSRTVVAHPPVLAELMNRFLDDVRSGGAD